MSEVKNTSGIKPLGRAVLVKYYEPERRESAIIIPESVENTRSLVEQRATVVEIGPEAWQDAIPRAAVGDKVLISRYAGYQTRGPADGQMYRLVNDNEIFAQITHEG